MNSDLVIKYLLINIFTYLIALKISNTKNIKYIQSISIIIGSVIVTIIYSILKEYLNFTLLFMIAFFIQIMFLTGIINKNTSIIITNLLANAIAHAIFIVIWANHYYSFPVINSEYGKLSIQSHSVCHSSSLWSFRAKYIDFRTW